METVERDPVARFKMEVGTATDVGRQRRRNEDRFATYLPAPEDDAELSGVLLVADGMGGERGGAEASQLAVERLLEELRRFRATSDGQEGLAAAVRRLIRDASDEIFHLGEAEPSLAGLGSTLVAAIFHQGRALVAHVGDSRCYRVREGGIERLTTDHTWVAGQLEAGTLTPEEARLHPQRNVLTRTLGDGEAPSADVRTELLEHEDLFILCSDGLTNALDDSEILTIARRFPRPQDLAEALVATANDQDGSDNVTVVACRCRDVKAEGEPDDTEPITRLLTPEKPRPWWRSPWLLAAAVVLVVAASFFLPRTYAVRVFERGAEAARQGRYLHARQDFVTAMRWGLDKERAEKLIDLLLTFPSVERAEEPADPSPDPADDQVESEL